MKKNSTLYSAVKMAEALEASRAGYHRFAKRTESKTKAKNRELLEKIRLIHTGHKKTYGSPRVYAELKRQGELCSRKRVAKIMRYNGIQAKSKRKWKATSYSKDLANVTPNLLNQNFKVGKANQVWVLDITYVATAEGWLYVSTVLDLFSRKIVGLSMGKNIDTALIIRSLNQAVIHRSPRSGLILHSDRGVQYRSNQFKDLARKLGLIQSMSAKGNCYDNAVMESFFHTLKTEHIFFNKYQTRKEAIESIFEYVEVFYNRQRIHSTLDYMSPVEFENQGMSYAI